MGVRQPRSARGAHFGTELTAGEAAIATEKRSIGVGLIGLGVVGSGVAAALSRRREYYAQQVGASIDVRKAAVRDLARQRAFDLPQGQLTTSVDDVINDPEIDIVIEVMGGVDPAGDYVRQAIAAGKHVVTANKELIAKHGPELLADAHSRGQDIMFEASVGGGIPLIAPLRRDLLANDIKAITAIINGTSNYILTRMSQEGADYAEALREAQQLGYAEADPTNDVDGYDAAYKLAIMATLGFRTRVAPENIERVGISGLTASDFVYAEELGYVIKLIASAQRIDQGVVTRVAPAFVPAAAPLAKVDGVYNAVQVEGDLTGAVMFQGAGAGANPTTSAVVADLIDLAHSVVSGNREHKYWGPVENIPVVSSDDLETRFYLRVHVHDAPGVLAQIALVLGEHNVSIAGVSQRESDLTERTAELVIMTHPTVKRSFDAALREIEQLPVVNEIRQHLLVEQ